MRLADKNTSSHRAVSVSVTPSTRFAAHGGGKPEKQKPV
jgi:hypothetical protein